MKSLLYSILCIITFSSCQQEPITTVSSNEYVELSINVKCNQMDVTKTLTPQQDREVKDINIYLFHKTQNIIKRQYVTSAMFLSFNLLKGEYDIYTIANYGFDLGDKTKNEIDNLIFSINAETDLERNAVLLMSAKDVATVNNNTSISIVLKRLVAKIDVSINVRNDFDFQLNKVQVISVPQTVSYFNDNRSNEGMNYNSHNSSNFSFYMLENMQGVNYSINKEQDKNSDIAPSNATYIYILGTCEGTKVEYRIYLGENNTNSFNVARNNNYTYSIHLKGINEVDSRVTTAVLSYDKIENMYIIGNPIISNISLSCTQSRGENYTLTISRLKGDGMVELNNKAYSYDYPIIFLNAPKTSVSFPFSYTQTSVSPVHLRFTIVDSNGFSFSKDMITQYIEDPNKLEVTTPISTVSKGGDKSDISFTATKENYIGDVKLKYELVSGAGAVKRNGITLTNGAFINASLGANKLEFTPTEVVDAELKITLKIGDETISKNIKIEVVKTVVTITRTDGDGVKYFINDNKWYNSATNKYILPTNFGASINFLLTRNWNGQYNRRIVLNTVTPNTPIVMLDDSKKESDWSGLYSEIIDGYKASYGFYANLTGTPNKFFELVVNK